MPAGITRRRLVHGAAAGAALALLPQRPARALADVEARTAMAAAATALLAALSADQRRSAVFDFDHRERLNWHYIPRRREGVPLKDMAAPAHVVAHDLMKVSLSAAGYEKAGNVMRLEGVLRQLETFGGLFRDPGRYYVTVFGAPDPGKPWGWRMEGHHLSLNFTIVPGKPIAVTPAFFGANPARVASGPLAGLRTLGDEDDLGLALARSVPADLRGRMVIASESLGDIVSGPGRGEQLKTPAGVALADLGAAQRELAGKLLETYARNMRGDVAEVELRRLREAGLERIHFAWAGPIDPARPHYYRLHGPTLLIELDDTQNDANHIHSVWHDPRRDFGQDLLRAHYEGGQPHRHG